MELAAFVVQAVLVEGRSVREVARAHGVSKTWLYELLARYRADGDDGLVGPLETARIVHRPGSPEAVEDEIVAIRKAAHRVRCRRRTRHDPHAPHAAATGGIAPCSVSTVWRILTRRGLHHPRAPQATQELLRPLRSRRSPTSAGRWTSPTSALKNGRRVEILNVIDDHSRLCLASRAFTVTTAADVVATFYEAAARYGFPASVLTDNGAIFTASFRGDRGALATELAHLGIVFKHSRPYHPQTCGKVERFHQTVKKYLAANPTARSLAAAPNPTRRLRRPTTTTNAPTEPNAGRPRAAAYTARVKARPAGNADPQRRRVPHPPRPRRPDRQSHPALRRQTPPPRHRTRPPRTPRPPAHRTTATSASSPPTGELIAQHHIDPDRTYQPAHLACPP